MVQMHTYWALPLAIMCTSVWKCPGHTAPCLQGVGERIAGRDMPKIVILNGSHDRETSACMAGQGPMGAADVVLAIQDSLNRRYTDCELTLPASAYVTAMLVPAGGDVHVDKRRLITLGVR